jgi:Caspase domain
MTRTLYATLVGIDEYQRPVPALNGCVNDIDAIALLLQEIGRAGGFAIDIRVLKNDQGTRSNVIAGFRDHLCKSSANDVALFYYSGHGWQESAPPEFWHIEPDHLNETLVCYDSRTDGNWDLADKELAVLIADVAARKPHILCVLDCCHSGNGTRAALEDGLAIRRAPTDRRLRPLESFLDGSLSAQRKKDKASTDANWLVMPEGRHVLLAACRSSETAKEVNEDGKPHGAFSAALLAALRQTRGALSYRDLVKRAGAQLRLCRRASAIHRRAQFDHQQSAARYLRYRSPEIEPGGAGEKFLARCRRGHRRDQNRQSDQTLRAPRRIRRDLHIPVFCSGRLYHRTEYSDRRRRLSRHVLNKFSDAPYRTHPINRLAGRPSQTPTFCRTFCFARKQSFHDASLRERPLAPEALLLKPARDGHGRLTGHASRSGKLRLALAASCFGMRAFHPMPLRSDMIGVH